MPKQNPCTWDGEGAIISNYIKDEIFIPSLQSGDVERIAAATLQAVAKLPWTEAPICCRGHLTYLIS